MKKSFSKKMASLVLAFAVAFTAVFASATTVQAAETDIQYLYMSPEYAEAGYAGQEVRHPFTLDQAGEVRFELWTLAPTGAKLAIYNSAGNLVSGFTNNPATIYASDWIADVSSGEYVYGIRCSLNAGTYYLGVTFDTDTYFFEYIYTGAAEAKISQESATITKGFSQKLYVEGAKVKSWTSKDKKIATVSKDGKVTAKKTGNTTVYATLEDGTKLTCKVKVKANEYKDTKGTTGDVSYGQTVGQIYNAKYDSKGNLVVKINIINNSYHRIDKLQNVKIVGKDPNGKKFVSYTLKSKSVSVSSGSCKVITLTIKKSSLKKKKVDLRNSEFSCSGTSVYYY